MHLSVADLFKTFTKGPLIGKPRLVKFVEKYKNKDEFELKDGKKINLIFQQETYKMLVEASKYPTRYQKELQKAQFLGSKGKQYYKITDFKKTLEFEGRPDQPPTGIQYELNMVSRLNVILRNIMTKHSYTEGVPIICNGKFVAKAASAEKVKGTPKADLVLKDIKGNDVVWISYKNGTTVRDFQQWSGITSPTMQSFPQIQEFLEKLRKRYPNGMQSGDNAGMHIRGDKSFLLKYKAVYGDAFKHGVTFGPDNVNFLIQGRLDLQPVGSRGYTIISSNAEYYQNGERLKPSADPILFAKYTSDRGQFGIPTSRILIYPFGGTTVKEWLDK